MTVKGLVEESGLARHEAERLLLAATGLPRSTLLGLDRVSPEHQEMFADMAARRRAGYPLQYLEGRIPFGPIEVQVDQRALIPRPETEYLWELASKSAEPSVVVDLCTGSGALALAAKHQWPSATVFGTDLSRAALSLAGENADRLDIDVNWREGDLFDALDSSLHGSIDLLLTNPPYVAESEFDELPDDVRLYEPRSALVAHGSGLGVIRRVGSQVESWLASGGEVWCEIGATQGEEAVAAFVGLESWVVQDLTGRDRYVHGVRR